MKQNLDVSVVLILPLCFLFLPYYLHPSLDIHFPPPFSPPVPSQVLLQQTDFAQDQRQTVHLQVQLQ